MKVGFAVQTDEGIQSKVYDHFGSAPIFIIVDIEGKEVLTINNKNLHHAHGQCNPIMALDGKSVDAMVVGGIGGAIGGAIEAMFYQKGEDKSLTSVLLTPVTPEALAVCQSIESIP